jgi:hypothetical protein
VGKLGGDHGRSGSADGDRRLRRDVGDGVMTDDDTLVAEAEPAEPAMSKADTKALMLLQACADFNECLLEISRGAGPDRPEALDRAVAALCHNQRLAHTVLRRHGFRPRGDLIEE